VEDRVILELIINVLKDVLDRFWSFFCVQFRNHRPQ